MSGYKSNITFFSNKELIEDAKFNCCLALERGRSDVIVSMS